MNKSKRIKETKAELLEEIKKLEDNNKSYIQANYSLSIKLKNTEEEIKGLLRSLDIERQYTKNTEALKDILNEKISGLLAVLSILVDDEKLESVKREIGILEKRDIHTSPFTFGENDNKGIPCKGKIIIMER